MSVTSWVRSVIICLQIDFFERNVSPTVHKQEKSISKLLKERNKLLKELTGAGLTGAGLTGVGLTGAGPTCAGLT